MICRVPLPTYIGFMITYLIIIIFGCVGNAYIILACLTNKVNSKQVNYNLFKTFKFNPASANNPQYPDCKHCSIRHPSMYFHDAIVIAGHDTQLLASWIWTG